MPCLCRLDIGNLVAVGKKPEASGRRADRTSKSPPSPAKKIGAAVTQAESRGRQGRCC